MSRDVPFDETAICDFCGINGAFDFVGDLICEKCFSAIMDAQKEVEQGKTKSFKQVREECRRKFGNLGKFQ